MRRFFTALPIPDDVSDELALMQGGIEGASWTAWADFHITLTFIGQLDDETLEEVNDALGDIRLPAFDYHLAGTGSFAQGDWPNVLWMGVDAPDALADLKTRGDLNLRARGIPHETRKYAPHVTMARLRHVERGEIAQFMQTHNLYRSRSIRAESFILYESLYGVKDSKTEQRYVPVAEYPLLPR